MNTLFLKLVLTLILAVSHQESSGEDEIDSNCDTDPLTRLTGDTYVYVGEEVRLYCNVSGMDLTHRNISFAMYRPYERKAAHVCIATEYVQMHNETAAVLTLPKVDGPGEVDFKCLLDSQCSDAGGNNPNILDCNVVGNLNVKIQYRPKDVTNFTCVLLNWETLTCTWQHPVHYSGDLNDTYVSLAYNSDATVSQAFNCPHYVNKSLTDGCVWSDIPDPNLTYIIEVNVRNSVTGYTASSLFVEEINKTVKPLQAQYLVMKKVVDVENCYDLSWQHTRRYDTSCEVWHKPPGSKEFQLFKIHQLNPYNKTAINDTICELTPNTMHTFFVHCYPGSGFSGYWSDKAFLEQSIPGPEGTAIQSSEAGLLITTGLMAIICFAYFTLVFACVFVVYWKCQYSRRRALGLQIPPDFPNESPIRKENILISSNIQKPQVSSLRTNGQAIKKDRNILSSSLRSNSISDSGNSESLEEDADSRCNLIPNSKKSQKLKQYKNANLYKLVHIEPSSSQLISSSQTTASKSTRDEHLSSTCVSSYFLSADSSVVRTISPASDSNGRSREPMPCYTKMATNSSSQEDTDSWTVQELISGNNDSTDSPSKTIAQVVLSALHGEDMAENAESIEIRATHRGMEKSSYITFSLIDRGMNFKKTMTKLSSSFPDEMV